MELEKFRMRRVCQLILVNLALICLISLTSCVGDFALFTYEAEIVFNDTGVIYDNSNDTPTVDAEGNEVPASWTTPIGVTTGIPSVDIISTIINNAGAVEAAKFLTVAIAGDPASISTLRARGFKKVTVIKKVLPIRGKRFQEAISKDAK